MILKCLPIGLLESNCYIVGDNGEGILIDPAAKADEIIKEVEKTGLKIKYVVLTHGHFDHIYTAAEVSERLGARIAVHEDDAEMLSDSRLNGFNMIGMKQESSLKADILLKDGDVLEAGGLKFEIIHTPGHTPGGICIKVGNVVFSGDTLFQGSIGRTDFPGGSYALIIKSIKERILTLPDETVVYPGHGPKTSVDLEKKINPFIN